jgi:hypothetical protein
MNRKQTLLYAALTATMIAAPASAAPVVLDFEDINPTYGVTGTPILEFYNGGTSNAGTSGPDLGVSFSRNALALCLNTPGTSCSNTSRGGLGDPNSQRGALVFLDGAETFLNYAAGFEDGFSFFYSAPGFTGSVGVYDGLNGSGNLLATLALDLTPGGQCDDSYSGGALYCPFVAAGVNFAGIARSISFAGTANFITFDDVTFGSATPGNPDNGVPEPATWAMMIGGMGAVGGAMRRRNRKLATA